MKINVIKSAVAYLHNAVETVVPGHGLHSVAWYEIKDCPNALYKISFWNRHAPVSVAVDMIDAWLSDDAPYAYIDKFGNIERDDHGRIKVTRRIMFLCPKTSDGLYMMGFNPLEYATKYVNENMVQTVFAYSKDDFHSRNNNL